LAPVILAPIGIDGGFTEIDHDLPGRATHGIDAADRGLALLRVTVDRLNGKPRCQAGYPCR
jgi:hypothetical protein